MQAQKERKSRNVAGNYLFFIDYYMTEKQWVQHTKHITAHKKEVEDKLEDVWVKREEVKKFEIYDNLDYQKMKKDIEKIIKNTFNKDAVVARNIKYYLIPLNKQHILKEIESNKN